MSQPSLRQFKALCFDCYGTLIDWEEGIWQGIQPLLTKAGASWTKNEALVAFNSVEKDIQVQRPATLYSHLLALVYEALAERLEVQIDPPESVAFGQSIRSWQPFPDTIQALERLSKHYCLVVLSNVDRESFDSTKAILEHGFKFNRILTAQDIGSYKPDIANFQYMLKTVKNDFDIGPDQVLVTANSLFHDHKPANALGLSSAWIVRNDSGMTAADATYTFQFSTLGEMAEAVDREREINP
ncbi:HAD-like protein [Sistotremastrum suecicum HHB10207 ss-3]|uniref:HAD-like protein n=1 Tax=Sistotremastrum suecicum HHB10207 ss-3 TaxID=1314776 RepID=A0A166AJQ8_9AGAM|nr:HAD-like protein [Sistotremastrum suecicum HHB10207 ss-3]